MNKQMFLEIAHTHVNYAFASYESNIITKEECIKGIDELIDWLEFIKTKVK